MQGLQQHPLGATSPSNGQQPRREPVGKKGREGAARIGRRADGDGTAAPQGGTGAAGGPLDSEEATRRNVRKARFQQGVLIQA